MKSIDNILGYLRTPLDLPVALFVASALVGVWASYDAAVSWEKFGLIVAAVAVYYGVVSLRAAPQVLMAFVWMFLIGCAALAVFFATQNDYAAEPGKFGFITAIGLLLNRSVPQLALHVPQSNILAGALEIGLPVGIAVIRFQISDFRFQISDAGRKDFRFSIGLGVSVAVCLVIAFGLVMTSSRGAWIALGVVGVGAVAAAFARDVLRRYAAPLALIALLGFAVVALRLGDALGPTLESVLGAVPAGGSAISRLELASQTWRLIQDYYFTGAGLGVFTMVYSTYTLSIDVPFLTHAHNLFLEVWIEQGLVGFVAFGWMIVEFYLWGWKTVNSRQSLVNSQQPTANRDQPTEMNWLMWGGVAAASVMLVHGLADVLLYSSRGLPMMLLPLGIAVASRKSLVVSQKPLVTSRQSAVGSTQSSVNNRSARRSTIAIALAVMGALVLLVALTWNALGAMWYANLGSVAQTKAELGQYRWPDRLVGEERKNCKLSIGNCQLSEAEGYFRQALALDPGNVTANERLKAIMLARGEPDVAREYFAWVYERDPMNTITWQLEANLDAAI